MYRPLTANNSWTYSILTRCCDNVRAFCIVEDLFHIGLITLAILYVYNSDTEYHCFLYIICPNVFITIVLSTILWLRIYCNEFDYKSFDSGACIAIVCVPVGILVSICLFPFLFYQYLCERCAMEQYIYFNHKYQENIFKYLFNRPKCDKLLNNLIEPILAINYYFLSQYDSKNGDKPFVKYIEKRNNDGKPFEFASWSSIRHIHKVNRTTFDLCFSFAVNLCVLSYRIYHLIFILFVWTYYFPQFITVELRDIFGWSVLIVLILNIILKCIIFIRFICQMIVSFVMFHILIPIPLIQKKLGQAIDGSIMEVIQEIENLFVSIKAQRDEIKNFMNRNDPDICSHVIICLILQYSTSELPL